MTPSELKANILAHDPDSHYFDRKTMQFFGDTMRNYGVRKTEIGGVPVWELYRKKPVKHKYNDDLEAVIAECRAQLADVMKEHNETWKKESVTIAEYKAIRKAARKDMMQQLEILVTSLV